MFGFGATFRLFVLALCLVPFTSAQRAAGVLAPLLHIPLLSAGTADVPVGEEEDEREGAAGKERWAAPTRHRAPLRELVTALPPAHAPHQTHLLRPVPTPPVAADPFRNGLGTPYRC